MPEEPSAEPSGALVLRPVLPPDAAFLLRVYSSTRLDEMALVPWTDEQRQAFLTAQFNAQQSHYQSNFPQARHEIICLGEEPIGRLYVLRTDQFIRILDLTILPEFRGGGRGSRILAELMHEAEAKRLPLRIYVESFNPSQRLFERLGFRKVEEQGIHFLMQWTGDHS